MPCRWGFSMATHVADVAAFLTRTSFRILADNINRCIPASQLITIKGAWHGAPRQQPAAFNEALLAFLARV